MPITPKQRGGPRKGAGRKPIAADAMERRNVMLDAATIAKAERIGNGNLSAGLRDAVRRVRANN